MQAPMAGVSTVKMAAEVAKAGALGSLPMASVNLIESTESVFEQIKAFRDLAGDKVPVNINFFAHDFAKQVPPGPEERSNWYKLFSHAGQVSETQLKYAVPEFHRINVSFKEFEHKRPEQTAHFIERLASCNVKIVSFHFGLPEPATVQLFHLNNMHVFACVTCVEEAQAALQAGVDALVCQGYEAGGHRGNFLNEGENDTKLTTKELFTEVRELVGASSPVFVVPAGGIVNGKEAGEFIKQGAAAVSMGTVFVTSAELSAPPYIGDVVQGAGEKPETVMTSLVSGKTARTLKTPFIEGLQNQSLGNLPLYGYLYYAYKSAVKLFPPGCGFYLAGKNYTKVTPGGKSHDIVRALSRDIKSVLVEE